VSTLVGHRWRMVSFTSGEGTVHVPGAERTMLGFSGDTLEISTPDEGYRLHYLRKGSGFRVRGDFYSSGTLALNARRPVVRPPVHDLIAYRPDSSVQVERAGHRAVVLVTQNFRIRCVRADGQPMSVPYPGHPSPSRIHPSTYSPTTPAS
jgi:hypothetical protein